MCLRCPRCLSEEMHQFSNEEIEYDLKNCKVVKIYWDSEHQTYVCQNCGFGFDGSQWRTTYKDLLENKLKVLKSLKII